MLTPPARAALQSLSASARQAWYTVTIEDEHAVSVTMEGPLNCMVYEMRPLKKARRVPRAEDKFNDYVDHDNPHTGTIININFIPEVLNVVVGRNTDVAAKSILLKSRCRVRDIARILESLVSRVQEHALLRVHALRLTR